MDDEIKLWWEIVFPKEIEQELIPIPPSPDGNAYYKRSLARVIAGGKYTVYMHLGALLVGASTFMLCRNGEEPLEREEWTPVIKEEAIAHLMSAWN